MRGFIMMTYQKMFLELEKGYHEDFPPERITEFLSWITDKLAGIPPECRSSARLIFEASCGTPHLQLWYEATESVEQHTTRLWDEYYASQVEETRHMNLWRLLDWYQHNPPPHGKNPLHVEEITWDAQVMRFRITEGSGDPRDPGKVLDLALRGTSSMSSMILSRCGLTWEIESTAYAQQLLSTLIPALSFSPSSIVTIRNMI